MDQAPILPKLPGFNFDKNLGRTNFHRVHHFDMIGDKICCLSEKEDPDPCGRLSIYPPGEEPELPLWLMYDGQRLMFKAYFQETVQERWESVYHIREVNISFFLEDGTMKVVEPPVSNSGLEQGVLVRRQKILTPDPVKQRYYDILDLNIGKEAEIYGRVYKIVDCDKFTRHFLNHMGISVPDPINTPKDPGTIARKIEDTKYPKKPSHAIDTLGDFLKYDKQVLRFYGYWDDSDSLYGLVHNLELHYYLSDNTIEIKETLPINSGKDSGPMFVRRMKIPKFYTGLEPIGARDPSTVLNVLGEFQTYYMVDSLGSGQIFNDYYKENELGIGTEMNVFGRRIIITDMDEFTKQYYRTKYGVDDFAPLARPKPEDVYVEVERYVPPYNGFGSYDDSLGNCFTVLPKAPKMDFFKFFHHDRQGLDSHVLGFRAKMISKVPDDEERQFIIRVYLMDDTISIFEQAKRNSGFRSGFFQRRMPMMLPNQDIFTSKKPDYYKPQDFYIGACLNLQDFKFEITTADIYGLRYMELHCEKFPKANLKLIMEKIRKSLQPVCDEFIQTYTPCKNASNNLQELTYEKLKEALYRYMGDNITEHEIITIARYYSSYKKKERHSKEYLKRLLRTELQRFLWHDLDRLIEDLHHFDRDKTGFLPRECLYTILRACRIPVDVELLNSVLDQLRKAEDGKLDYNDLLQLIDMKIDPLPPAPPVNVKMELWWASEKEPHYENAINWCHFIKDLDIDVKEKPAENGDIEIAECIPQMYRA